ncbi:adenosine deaminase [Streptococcus dentapri]|uniref:Adenosine deaminase n=1 Tax=Streptococcus dentapri TaxID=573564 RepID=A0ABV8D3C6_9STRE
MDTNTLQQLAKAELHCHLDGSLSFAAIRRLAEMTDITLPDTDAELQKLVTAPETCESLVDYLATFEVIRPLLQTKEALQLAAYDVAKQAALENVIYLEVRFAPELSMDKGLSANDAVRAVLAGLKEAAADFGITAKALACGMRQSDPQLTHEILAEIVDLAPQGLVGFDFAGDEHSFPPASIEKLIREVQLSGYPFTLHAGECGCPSHIADTLKLGIKRLGHATAITNHPELITDFVQADATAELCLTSNLQTKAAQNLLDFPYQQLYEADANITINTDNRTVSNTNLTKEYSLFAQYFGTGIADFFSFNKNAISASFTNTEEKRWLLTQLEESYLPYL